jgi:predicted  nucleic acid-binding Zn-ribbon protein
LQLLEEQEMLAEETTRLEAELTNKRDNSKGQIDEITKKSEEIDAIIAQIAEKRDEITKEISQQLVNRYNQIRQGRQALP